MSDPTPDESLVAAIEGDLCGMSRQDLVLTREMLERGRAAWRKDAEQVQAENERLRALNAELLDALKSVQHLAYRAGREVADKVHEAIAKAEGKE